MSLVWISNSFIKTRWHHMIDSRAPLTLRYLFVWPAPRPHCTATAVFSLAPENMTNTWRQHLHLGFFWLHFSTVGARESAPSIFIQVCDLAIWCDLSAKRNARLDWNNATCCKNSEGAEVCTTEPRDRWDDLIFPPSPHKSVERHWMLNSEPRAC